MMNKLFGGILLLIACSQNVAAKPKSQLEIGAGLFSVQLPHYVGAQQRKTYLLPTPYIYYSSDEFKVERNQLTGFLWKHESWQLDLSAGAGISINSEDNNAREGMPDLDWVFELGPSLKYFILGSPASNDRLYGEFFARKAIATDFSSVGNVGWRYGPSMSYHRDLYINGEKELILTLRANINYSDAKYLNYYYGIKSDFVTPTRAIFEAKSGYAGSDFSMGLTYKTSNFWYGGFVRYYALRDSVEQYSPLVFEQDSWAAGLGFAWIFYKR